MHNLRHYQYLIQEWYICFFDQPTTASLTPKGVNDVLCWWCTFCKFGQLHNDTQPPFSCHAQQLDCLKNPLYSTYLFFSPTPCQPLIFPLPPQFCLFQCHASGIMQYGVFSNYLLSHSDILVSFHHIFSWFDSSSLFSIELSSIIQMYQNLFNHSCTEEHCGCSQIWAIMNKAANKHLCAGFCFQFFEVNTKEHDC